MATYLERYLSGEHEQVWQELVNWGDFVREEPLLSDARAVARETMRRARYNIEQLVPRLESIGYRFGILLSDHFGEIPYWKDYPVFAPSSASTRDAADELEAQLGSLPLSLRAFFDKIDSVNLVGYHPEWGRDVNANLDALMCYSLDHPENIVNNSYDPAVYDKLLAGREDWAPGEFPHGSLMIDIAPDCMLKVMESGGGPYSIRFPSLKADEPVRDFTTAHEPDPLFVEYLRLCFRWGGFPGLKHLSPEQRAAFPLEHLDVLTRDLLPL